MNGILASATLLVFFVYEAEGLLGICRVSTCAQDECCLLLVCPKLIKAREPCSSMSSCPRCANGLKCTNRVSVHNPVSGALIDNMSVAANPDTFADVLNTTITTIVTALVMNQRFSPKTKPTPRDEYDYIVVGAGAAGSVLANRLSEKKCVTVLLLEAGKTPPATSETPAFLGSTIASDANWGFRTEPQQHTAEEQIGNSISYDCGKVIGGSSILNAMLYSRGNKQDYDNWEGMGAEGWSYNKIFRYFLKLENNTDLDLVADGSCHNVSGPMTFSRVRYTSPLEKPVKEGAKSLGYEIIDVNCRNQLGFADLQTFIRNGQRCSAAKAYLVPVDHRPNLDIVAEALVTRIQINNKTAQGVCLHQKGVSRCVKARREVIVSAGSVNSAKLLILSGVGPRETLNKFKIPEHANLPVGLNLQDHITAPMFFTVPSEVRFGAKVMDPRNVEQYETNRTGPLASPIGVFTIGFHRSADAVTPEGASNIQSYFVEWDHAGTTGIFGLKPSTYGKMFLPYESNGTLMCATSVLKPKSRGFVTIRSRDPQEKPVIDPKFLSHQQDVEDLVEGLKLCYKIVGTAAVKKAGIKPLETKMPGCEKFPSNSTQYFKCYVKKFTFAIWHPAGTVKMGNVSDFSTVVDPKFRVKGIRNLRVIDASTMPEVVSGNTMIPTMMMAEKGSDMIKETIRCR